MPVYTRKRTTRKRILTKAQRLVREKAIIRDLRGAKLSYRKIAEKHKVSLPTVNAKARKAGITRSRRGPAALVRATRTRARTTTPTRATTTRTRAKARTRTVARAKRKVWKKKTTRRTTAARTVARRTVRPTTRSVEKFNEQLRWLVLNYYPNMPLKKFEHLTKIVGKAIS